MSDTVTLNYRNYLICGYPTGGFWFPRWIRVQVLARKGQKCRVAAVDWDSEPFDMEVRRCACGIEFGFQPRRGDPTLCRSCDTVRLTERQRRRRKEQRDRIMRTHCAFCGSRMAAERITRKYCSGTCRVAAMRERRD